MTVDLRPLLHPVRMGALRIIIERGEASPMQITEELGRPAASLGVVSYHVRRLEAAKLIELVRREPRRGAVEHFYAPSRKGAYALADRLEADARELRAYLARGAAKRRRRAKAA